MNYKICFSILCVIIILGCQYKGDGAYKKGGPWYARYQVLTLPQFNFIRDGEYNFNISGLNTKKTSNEFFLRLCVISSEPIDFSKFNAVVELSVLGKNGELYFHIDSALNAHYIRMLNEKKSLAPLPDEWFTRYKYGISDIDKRVIPFSTNSDPLKVYNIKYSQNVISQRNFDKINIKIKTIPSDFDDIDVVGYVELFSGGL